MILAEELRKAVLQAAIQGKLVDHRQEEGTGRELYTKIQEEKASLIKQGKIKAEKPLPEISDDDTPFDIPETWIWVKLGNLTSKIGAGSTPSGGAKAGIYTDKGVPFIREMNVYDDGIHQDGMVFISQELSSNRENSKFFPGDILLNITGGSIGRCAIVPPEIPIGDVNQHVEIIRLIDPSLDSYIHVLIRSPFVQAIINNRSVGDKAGFSATKCKNIEVPLPPLQEQIRIVTRLNEITEALDSYACAERELAELQAAFPGDMRKSILQYAMQGKLVRQIPEEGTGKELYQQIQSEKDKLIKAGKLKKEKSLSQIADEDTPFDIPDSWTWVHLNDIVSKEIKRGKPPVYTTKGSNVYVFAQKCNVKNGGIDLGLCQFLDESVLGKYPEEEFMVDNDIVINSTGTGTLGRVGLYSITDNPAGKLLVPDSHVTIVRLVNKVHKPFIYYIICNYQKYLESKGSGTTKQKELKPDIIKSLLIPIPPLQEQKRIADKLDQILPHIMDLKEAF